ncbi:hypothetical protein HMPREF9688_03362 [Klebsiella oxytoca 10-5244]|uniref:hypothetical protein n=1 Tax=Klebsiella oxytoca TaxID=571 RepID=UPI000671ECA5|nr:hypothetical protein [Klebsiella oxytoca]KMV90563.1 hypothetical protein HMPREF9688_03362 [Klebsiella oxytoca 10-5244]
MTTDITELAQRMKAAAEKLDVAQWQTRKGFSGIEVIVKGSLEKGTGCVSFQPVAADLADTKTARAIALFSPANVLALVEALEKAQKSNEFLKGQLSELANFNPDWDKLEASYESWREIAAELLVAKERIAELESRTVKLPDDLHPDTQELVIDFCTALAEKLYKAQLKYGYDADWKQDGWPSQCQAHFHQHIAKGDPRDVAAYCAFMWWHGWSTKPAEGLESRTVTVKLPDIMPPEAAPAHYWVQGESMAYADGYNKSAADLKTSIAQACSSAGVNVEFE